MERRSSNYLRKLLFSHMALNQMMEDVLLRMTKLEIILLRQKHSLNYL